MSYIGAQSNNRVSPNFVKENFTGTGSTTTFTLTNEVPGGNPDNILVVVNNVIQEPVAYTIGDDQTTNQKFLIYWNVANGDRSMLTITVNNYFTFDPAGWLVRLNYLMH